MKPVARELFVWLVIALVVFGLGCLVFASCASAKQAPEQPQALSKSAPVELMARDPEPALPTPRCSDPEHDAGSDMDWAAIEQHAQPGAVHDAGGQVVAAAPPPALQRDECSAWVAAGVGLFGLMLCAAILWPAGARRALGSRPW